MRRINRCLNNRLVNLCQRTFQLEELNIKLKEYLPDLLREQCWVGSFNKGCLLLMTNDAVWASQLHYKLPELRDKLRQEGGVYQLTSIKVQVRSVETIKIAMPQKALTLSGQARERILEASAQCSYEPLKHALQKLASNSIKITNKEK